MFWFQMTLLCVV